MQFRLGVILTTEAASLSLRVLSADLAALSAVEGGFPEMVGEPEARVAPVVVEQADILEMAVPVTPHQIPVTAPLAQAAAVVVVGLPPHLARLVSLAAVVVVYACSAKAQSAQVVLEPPVAPAEVAEVAQAE